MIKLKIKYGNSQTDIRFPCTEKEMNAALERIHAEDVTPLELYVSEVVFPEELGCLQDRFVNLDEVNFLGKRMDSFFGDEEYQFYEAKAIGADAVLLIAAILDDVQMHEFYQLAGELGLDALVEVHDEAEMERALKLDAKIIGVNNRNLKDFSIDLQITERLSRMVPQEKLLVAESGIVSDEDVEFLKACGVNAFLIGRAFMEAEHPGEVAARWKQR